MSKTIDEGLAGALVKLAGKALKSQSVRQSARTGALGAGLAAAWKNTYGGSNKQRPNPSQQPTSRRSAPNDTWSRMVSTESGGRQFGSSGQTLTSHKGAIGAAQIMPQYGAEFAQRAGVEWDERKARTDRDYNLKLGRAQFDHLVNTYKGDHARAAAAYNAGPGGLRRAERAARAAGRPDAWREYLPQETKDYVRKVIREETPTHYMSKRDLINRVVDTYSVQPQEQASLQELFVQCVETLKESHTILLLRLFNDLSENNQEIMFDLVQTNEGVRELLDFAIDKYMIQKD